MKYQQNAMIGPKYLVKPSTDARVHTIIYYELLINVSLAIVNIIILVNHWEDVAIMFALVIRMDDGLSIVGLS